MRNVLPDDATSVVVVISGGLDSTIALYMCVKKYGANKVKALSFDYGQKQRRELMMAAQSTKYLGVEHKVLDLDVLHDLSMGVSANVDPSIPVPPIEDVLGDPAPSTEVPFRNLIMMSLAASYAQGHKCNYIVMGLQIHDLYSYWDTTELFVSKVNSVLTENRKQVIKILTPLGRLSKTDELNLFLDLDGPIDLLSHTLSCYDPDPDGRSCGRCATCAERLKAFANIGMVDPIPYV